MRITQLRAIDFVVMATYALVVLAVGWGMRRRVRSADDFLQSPRDFPAWVTGLAFLSANLGILEVVGMGAAGARFGFAAAHLSWIGAIPAMVFLGLFMMPVYHASGARSVPEYLGLRFDEKTRTVVAVAVAAITLGAAGASIYLIGKLANVLLGWGFGTTIVVAAGVVAVYLLLGGLGASIYNGVLQLVLVLFTLAPLVYLGVRATDSWSILPRRLTQAAINSQLPPAYYTHLWKGMGHPLTNSLGVEWFGLMLGVGGVLSFAYWCADFRVLQRAMAAPTRLAAVRTPLIAALPKLLLPALLVLPGVLALMLGGGEAGTSYGGMPQGLIPARHAADGRALVDAAGRSMLDFDLATPIMIVSLLPSGMLGLGVTAILAAFMAGLAASLTAFTSVWTYDLRAGRVAPVSGDDRSPRMGRVATVGGLLVAMGVAYAARAFDSIVDFLPLVFAHTQAPLFTAVVVGMFWKRATGHGAFWGMLAGTLAAVIHHGISLPVGTARGIRGGYLALLLGYRSDLAQACWTAIAACAASLVTMVVVSLLTRPRPDDELTGLVYRLTPRATDGALRWWQRPGALAVVVLAGAVALNLLFS